jgi:farnesyl diphosphate synthase
VTDFRDQLTETAARVAEFMDSLLPLDDIPERRLIEAMRYATVAGGKRIRPFMVVAGARMFGVAEESSLRTAAAIEMIHCYSLVHDDLPAMDDDDLRRGQPTCHRQFDEATAILAGDGLLTQAFEVLAHPATHSDPAVRADLVLEMAKAAGPQGMVGGQMADLRAEEVRFGIDEITRMQRMKTGALIAFSCEAGAILGKAPPQARLALKAYAHDLGLAFQIVDDLLDVEGDEKEVGKKVRKDADAGKATFVSLLGLERAREQARLLGDQAVRHLEIFAEKADPLRGLAAFILNRRS